LSLSAGRGGRGCGSKEARVLGRRRDDEEARRRREREEGEEAGQDRRRQLEDSSLIGDALKKETTEIEAPVCIACFALPGSDAQASGESLIIYFCTLVIVRNPKPLRHKKIHLF
jgi:hypothetical protein